jgi:hypothetical protein
MGKKELLDILQDVWLHAGAAHDNDEPLDADWIQAEMLKCRDAVEVLVK